MYTEISMHDAYWSFLYHSLLLLQQYAWQLEEAYFDTAPAYFPFQIIIEGRIYNYSIKLMGLDLINWMDSPPISEE